MLKLLHTADIHLGAKFLGLGEKGALQRDHLKSSFKKITTLAKDENVNVVLIAGDLFDSNEQSKTNIDLVVEQFQLLAESNIAVCIIPGTHDCYDNRSVYRKYDLENLCSYLTVFKNDEWQYKEFPEIDLTIYGRPNLSNKSYTSPLNGLKRMTETRFHVAMAHGSLNIPGQIAEDDHVFSIDEIQNSGMHYIALGHWHRPYACTTDGVITQYAGPPEMISTDQKEPGSVVLVTIKESGTIEREIRRISNRYCDEIEVDLSDIGDTSELKQRISEGSDPNLSRRVVLNGLRNEDLIISPQDLEANFGESFFHLRIVDESHPRLTDFSIDSYQDQLIVTKFIQLMTEHIESCHVEEKVIAEEALQYGLALLQGKDVI